MKNALASKGFIFKYQDMPSRDVVARQFADLMAALSHPQRLRIALELRAGELDVKTLTERLGIAHSSTSQHLSLLRAHHLVVERREGRRVFYHLAQPALATWLVSGLKLLEREARDTASLVEALDKARTAWSRGE